VSPKWRLEDPAEDQSLGVSSVRAWYDAPLDACVEAARRALNQVDFIVIGGDLRPSEARIDARSESGLAGLVRITVLAEESGGSWVNFSAGRDWSQDGVAVVEKLKASFELCLKARGGESP
jgi:hypothetical protein